ncbi:MAG: hypothetical protein NUV74_16985, partial [Candidatus Brocadiaceae bacterium]|nr:hypothetical protein [Candidatus Brocadiaceae bacterium]
WVRTIEALSGEDSRAKQLALFPDGREELPAMDYEVYPGNTRDTATLEGLIIWLALPRDI